jgi:hypothetical protein
MKLSSLLYKKTTRQQVPIGLAVYIIFVEFIEHLLCMKVLYMHWIPLRGS